MDRIYEKFFSLMVNNNQSTMDKMLDTLNEKANYQQCTKGVLPKLDKFLNGYYRNIMNKVFDLPPNTYYLQKFNALMADVPWNSYLFNYVVCKAN